jgi:hypothetical protein
VTRRAAALAAVALAFALACAHAPRDAGPPFAFPRAFDANQAVTVRMDGDTRELLASLRWRAGDLDVTLFEPAFAVPLLHATRRGGAVKVETLPGGPDERAARRLVELLGELYAQAFQATAADRAEGRSRHYAFRLEGVQARGECAFPEAIEVDPRMGPDVHVRVRTLDLSCPAGGALGD